MKIKFIILFCIFSSSILFGQKASYTDLIRQGRVIADSIALEYYEEAFKITDNQANDLYNAACYAARFLENHDRAFYYLHKAIENGYYDVNHMENDLDLQKLRSKSEWKELVEKAKLNEEKFSENRVFEKIKEYILSNNSNALWELYEGKDKDVSNVFDMFFDKKTTINKKTTEKITFEEFSELIEEIYTFTQENNIKNFNFKNFFDLNSGKSTGSSMGMSINISSGVVSSVTERIKKCAALTPLHFNVFSDEKFPLPSRISEMEYNVCVEIEKKDTLGFRITTIYTKTNYLGKDFDLFERVKNNFANTKDCIISVSVLKPKQRISYSFLGQASKKDIEIINKLKILNHKENTKPLDVDELYVYVIRNSSQSKYIALVFSEINNKTLIIVDEKYGLFEIENIKPLGAYIEKLRKR